MPELPEVQAVVSALAPVLPGMAIARVTQRRRDIASRDLITRGGKSPGILLSPLLRGRTLRAITRRAKRIVFTLDDGAAFYIHLGMSGRLTLNPPAQLPHTHLTLHLTGPRPKSPPATLAFCDPRRFGKVVYLPTGQHEPTLGPEPLTLSAPDLHIRLRRTKRGIKAALLDQHIIAGLGNIYVDESLHAAGLHPRRTSHTLTLPEVRRLLREIQRVLRRAITHKGSTLRDYRDANGNPGAFQTLHKVYDRRGKPCQQCQTPIQSITEAGRTTHFCPKCQPRRSTRRKPTPSSARQCVPRSHR